MDQFLNEQQDPTLVEKWSPILEHASMPKIEDAYRKQVTAALLENQAAENKRQALQESTPTNVTAGAAKYDPVLMSMVRRTAPAMIAFDVCGVQPMSMPTGLVFALRSRYTSQSGTEALWQEANTAFSGTGTHTVGGVMNVVRKGGLTSGSTSVTVGDGAGRVAQGMLVYGEGIPANTTVASVAGNTVTLSNGATATNADAVLSFIPTVGSAMSTAQGEGDIAAQMGVSIEKIAVEAKTRALKAEYSVELAQDMQAVHGLDAENELINICSNEVLAEINREVLRNIYAAAKLGAIKDTTIPGIFDLQKDADGRWSAERFKGLHFAIERDANGIAFDTKRGKGNILIVSADVASALAAANILSTSNLDVNVTSDWTKSTFVGTIHGRIKVYVDPYAEHDFYCLGYKGESAMDAGLIYSPYVPLQLYRAVDPASMQPKLGLKTRYSLSQNILFNAQQAVRSNAYYRIANVANVI